MKIDVQLFARARDLAGRESVELELPESASVGDMRSALAEQVPGLEPIAGSLLVAVGTDYAPDSQTLDTARPVACFPPVSGG